MELHIDTKKDSPEELRKAIRFLELLVGDQKETPKATEETIAQSFSMFEQPEPAPEQKKNEDTFIEIVEF